MCFGKWETKRKRGGKNEEKGFKILFFLMKYKKAHYVWPFSSAGMTITEFGLQGLTIHIQCTAAVLSLLYVQYTLKLFATLPTICYVWKVFYCAWTLPYMFCQFDVSKVRFLSNPACSIALSTYVRGIYYITLTFEEFRCKSL